MAGRPNERTVGHMTTTLTSAPIPASSAPSTPAAVPHRGRATCAWCHQDFSSIPAMLRHVDDGHAPLVRRGFVARAA